MDTIIASRNDTSCSKVTLVAHSGAANQATCSALEPGMADKVGKLVTLAPCINFNPRTYAIEANDLRSYYLINSIINEQFGINTIFGPGFD